MSQAAVRAEETSPDQEYGLVVRAAVLCNPFLDILEEVTLAVRGPMASSLLDWNATLFTPILHPLLLEVLDQTSKGGSFEITALDCRLDAELPASRKFPSRDAGKLLVQGVLAPRGDRMIERYRTAVLAGDSPGHLAVIHALRAAVFHLPPRVTVASYLLQEGIGAGLDGREISRFLLGAIIGAESGTSTSGPTLAEI